MKSMLFIKENMVRLFVILLGLFKTYHCQLASQNQIAPSPSTSVSYSSSMAVMVIPSTFADIPLSTKITVISITSNNSTDYPQSTTALNINQNVTAITHVTISKEYIYSTATKFTTNPMSTYTPTPNTPQPPSKTPTIPHRVGLIIGVVCGLVILSLCLIIFHKKEARLRCLKLMCKPCTKNYSRYNIVPIYVYDDVEQDIRELQDDSDLPLV